jgi:hypothetical protein
MRRPFLPLSIVLSAALTVVVAGAVPQPPQPVLGSRAVKVITVEGRSFRDLNRSGALDPYEDWRLPAVRRAADLVARMTLEEKAGTLMHGTAPSPWGGPPGAGYDAAAAERIILGAHVSDMITRLGGQSRRPRGAEQPPAGHRGALAPRRPADDQHRPAESLPVHRGRERRRRRLLEVA